METLQIVFVVVGILICAVIFFLIGMFYRKKVAEREITSAEEEAKRIEEARRAKMRKQIEKEEAEPLCCPSICQVQAGGGQDLKVDSCELRCTSGSLRY